MHCFHVPHVTSCTECRSFCTGIFSCKGVEQPQTGPKVLLHVVSSHNISSENQR